MALHESRLLKGTLKLGPTGTGQLDMSCQVTNVRIGSAYSDDGSSVTTLCGDTVPAPRMLDGHKLEGTFVQDFDFSETAGGVIAYLWTHDLETVAFEFVPDDPLTGPTVTGDVLLEIPAETFGGDAGKRVTSDFAWNMPAKPTIVWPGGAATAEAHADETVPIETAA
jgi:hypothetical protein